MKIPYGRQSISEEDIQAVVEVLRSDWLTQGPKVREFEQALCELTGAKHCIAVCNGTAALHLACLALGVGPGDVGITSPISFVASANCIAYCGGIPDFADIDPRTLCLSPDEVEKKCERGPVPKVVIPVDFAGVPADLPHFRRLADKYGFYLIEDAAHAIGSTYTVDGQTFACGSCAHTDLATFSFHPVKTITTGEGGAVMTNSDNFAEKVRRLANHGIERDPERLIYRELPCGLSEGKNSNSVTLNYWYHEMQDLGFNARITDLQCALGLSQLKRLEIFKNKRQDIVNLYNQKLEKMVKNKFIIRPPWPIDANPCFHLYVLRLGKNSLISRNELVYRLRENDIFCQIHYIPIFRQLFYYNKLNFDEDIYPEADLYFKCGLSLPLFPELNYQSVFYVIKCLYALIT